jgi:NAD(P)H dehydrogenase (quinone)
VERRFADYNQPESLRSAYSGLDKLVLIPSSEFGLGVRTAQSASAVDAAVAAGVKHIVLVSSVHTRDMPEPHIAASYFLTEQRVMRTAPRWTIMRSSYYAESFAREAQLSLERGVLAGLGENRVSFVSRDDIAAAIAGVPSRDGHDGAIYYMTGPESVSGAERAMLAADISGKPVAFRSVPEGQLRAGFQAAGLPTAIANALIDLQIGFLDGAFDIVSGHIEHLARQPPRRLRDVLAATLQKSDSGPQK